MPMTRRQALSGLALAAAARPAAAFAAAAPERTAALLPRTNVCVLTAQAEEGPFYLDPKQERSDVTEGRPGVPLRLVLQIVDAATCVPITGARVDIWQANAEGNYSGFGGPGEPPSDSRYLRGTQFADAAGEVRFSTIYPGWYHGRTVHMHAKIILDGKAVMNAQIYFPDALSEYIHGHAAPYARKELRDTSNATDGVLRASGGTRESFCSIKEEADHYLASLIIAADRNGTPIDGIAGGPPPGMGGPPGPPPGFKGGPPPGPPPFGHNRPRPADWDQTMIPGLVKRPG